MTNAELIFNNRIFLMEQGVIKGVPGTQITITDENGTRELLMPEEIHTYNSWRKLGYQVRKGEHAVARFPIWKFKAAKQKDTEPDEDQQGQEGKMFRKVAFFFTIDQVDKIRE